MKNEKTHLYRHFDENGTLLYVGISLSAIQRLGQHEKNAKWFESIAKVTIENCYSREDALSKELLAINPLHNINRKTIPPNWDALYEVASFKDIIKGVKGTTCTPSCFSLDGVYYYVRSLDLSIMTNDVGYIETVIEDLITIYNKYDSKKVRPANIMSLHHITIDLLTLYNIVCAHLCSIGDEPYNTAMRKIDDFMYSEG